MSKTINIIVEGGVVVDVEGLPEDWDVAITDLDRVTLVTGYSNGPAIGEFEDE